jgi:surface protein
MSGVTDLTEMFTNCVNFNQDLSSWDVSSVTSLYQTFAGCSSFNQDLSSWNVGQVTDMSGMFLYSSFNSPLNNWDVRNVTTFRDMFAESSFNGSVLNWNASGVPKTMEGMFELATAFNNMATAANSAGIKLKIVSGFRSVGSQKSIFENLMNKRNQTPEQRARVSAPPGYSQHHTGLAIDINSTEVTFAKTKAFKWLQQNAKTYGFTMPFTKDNQQGIDFEPWHWIFTGTQRARNILEPLTESQFNSVYAGNTSVYKPD